MTARPPTRTYTQALDDLKGAAASADLTAEQQSYVDGLVKIGEQLKTGSGTGITATAPVQLGDMATNVDQLITSTLDTNGTPDARTQALAEAVNARLSLVKQQLLIQGSTQSSASLLDSVWLAAELGVEGQALQSIKGNGTGSRRLNNLIAANGTRLGQATTEKAVDPRCVAAELRHLRRHEHRPARPRSRPSWPTGPRRRRAGPSPTARSSCSPCSPRSPWRSSSPVR